MGIRSAAPAASAGRRKSPGAPQKKDPREKFLAIVEKIVPPAAMTVLAYNAMASPVKETPSLALPVLVSAGLTAALHLWKRNALFSIVGGTALYMILGRVL